MVADIVLLTWTAFTSNRSFALCLDSFGFAGVDVLSDSLKSKTRVHGKCPTK